MPFPENHLALMLPDTVTSTVNQHLSVIRLEFSHEGQAQLCSHPPGCIVIVLEGIPHCQTMGRTVTRRSGDLLPDSAQAKRHSVRVAVVNALLISVFIGG